MALRVGLGHAEVRADALTKSLHRPLPPNSALIMLAAGSSWTTHKRAKEILFEGAQGAHARQLFTAT